MVHGLATLIIALACLPAARAADTPDDPQPISAADWPMYNHDVAGWRFNPAEKTLSPSNVGKLVEKWRFPAADSTEKIGVVHATPTVVGGEVYFGTATQPAFYKLDKDGKQLWVYRNPVRRTVLPPTDGAPVTDKLRAAAASAGIFSSALVADGAVYFADTGGWLYCLDAKTGKERWKVDTRAKEFPGAHWNNLSMASPILADGKVIFAGGTLEQLIAGTKDYPGSTGRGFIVALAPRTGKIKWKYDVGPKPEKLDPPVVIEGTWGKYKFESGPATSSVWSTPTYDAESNALFFGTDVNTAPRQPTKDNPNLHTEDSCAIVCVDAATGKRRWSTQINPGDVWTNSMRAYDPKTGLYKDCSIGDSPKVFSVAVDGRPTRVVGAGCKNGGFYILRADNGKIVRHTPLYTGKPTHPPEKHDRRVLALPGPVGGLQTGCATDGKTIYTNGIDAIRLATQASPLSRAQLPTGGRVTATSVDLATERWRHERPKIPAMGGTPEKPMHKDVGDIVGSGIAVGNGVAYFTAVGSGKLIALDTASGKVLKEIRIGPVWAGPSLSRGRVYVGGGNTLFNPNNDFECFFPKQNTGSVRCFGLPDEDDEGDRKPAFKVPDNVSFRAADIFSEGTRMSAEVFAPKDPKSDKLPTIVMSHGWGGTAAALRPDAIKFAQAGYLVVAFDYRG
jgi:outer membrane protein assembly factor BamB